MLRDDLRSKIEDQHLSSADAEIAGEILAETPEEELDVLAELLKQDGALGRLIQNYKDEAEERSSENIFDGAPDLIGRTADEEGGSEQ